MDSNILKILEKLLIIILICLGIKYFFLFTISVLFQISLFFILMYVVTYEKKVMLLNFIYENN